MGHLISALEKHGQNSPMVIGTNEVTTFNNCYADDGMPAQVPADGGFLGDIGVAIVTMSPSKSDLKSTYKEADKKRSAVGMQLAERNVDAMKRQKVRAVPAKKLCIYLREDRITTALEDLEKKKNGLVAHGFIKSLLGDFKIADKKTWKPFDKLGLDGAPHGLGFGDRRLLLEDYMMLQPGEEVRCLITKKHPFIESNKGGMMKVIQSTIKNEPYHPIQFGQNVYFIMHLIVRSNKNLGDFEDGVLERSEMIFKCKEQQGNGIVFDFVATFGKNGIMISPKCIFFSTLIENPKEIMFFKNDTGASRVVDIKSSLHDLKDMNRVAAIVSVFSDELYGDSLMTYALAEYWEHRSKRYALELELKNYKEAPVSDAKVETRLILKNDDAEFKSFRDYMNNKCHDAIINIYGRFSVISQPILSQPLLRDLTYRFVVSYSNLYSIL